MTRNLLRPWPAALAERCAPSRRTSLSLGGIGQLDHALTRKGLDPYDALRMTASLDIYLIGICGTGMGTLAGMLQRVGHRVRGSDEHVYPPMSDQLRAWGIEVTEGFDAQHLQPPPDLVVVGNVIRKSNPEAQQAEAAGLRVMSMPEAIAAFGIGNRHSIVVAGTHGKTTVTSLCAHVLLHAGHDPSFLVGGVLQNYDESFRVGHGPCFVVEGDEYDSAYFDKGPKFLHYRPRTAIITSLEYDHADIFPDVAAIERAFAALLERVPDSGHVVVWQGAERATQLLDAIGRPLQMTRYDVRPSKGVRLWVDGWAATPAGLVLEPILDGTSLGSMVVPLWGRHNALNVLACIAAVTPLGVDAAAIAPALASFAGVKRRLEVIGDVHDVTVVDDFAHHPTAIAETLAAARSRWPDRRLWAVFEPRSATNRRNVHQHALVDAFAAADRIVIASHARLHEIPVAERFDPERLAGDLTARGQPAIAIAEPSAIAAHLAAEARAGDVMLLFSNGDFGGLHRDLLERLTTAQRGAA